MQSNNHHGQRRVTMLPHTYFERLIESATIIARHPDYLRKGEAVDQCRREVEDLLVMGRIDPVQAEALREILSTGPGTTRPRGRAGWQAEGPRPDQGRATRIA